MKVLYKHFDYETTVIIDDYVFNNSLNDGVGFKLDEAEKALQSYRQISKDSAKFINPF